MGKSLIKNTLFVAALCMPALPASEEFGFVGVSLAYQQFDPGIYESDHTTFGVHAGRQSLNFRTTFGLEYESDFRAVSIEADYIFLDEMFGTPKLRPYIGLNANYIDYSNHYDYARDITIDGQGYSIGINGGFIIYAGERVDVDIGYHYNSVQKIPSADILQGFTFSIHYFY